MQDFKILFYACFAMTPAIAAAQNLVTLNSHSTYQTMHGWEVTPFVARQCDPAFYPIRNAIVPLAVDDIGIDRVRLEVRSGVENGTDYYAMHVANGCPNPPDSAYYVWRYNRYATVNDNDDPQVINWDGFHFTELDWQVESVILPMQARLEAAGESLFVNLLYVAFTGQIQGGGAYHHDDPEEYAEFVLATFLHLRDKYNLIPDAFEILLEPDNVPHWNGETVGRGLVAAVNRLHDNNFHPQVIAPSCASMGNAIAYFDQMIQVPGVLDLLEVFSYHRYGHSLPELRQIASRAAQRGLETAMLEWWFGNATYEVLYEDLTIGRNSAWQGHVLNSLFEIDASDTTNIKAPYKRETKYNRQYYKFIRRGAVRIEAASNNENFASVAFINTDGRYVVVVKAAAGGSIAIQGLPVGVYGIKYTTGLPSADPIAYDVDLPDASIGFGESLATSIPAAGLITIYGKTLATAVHDDRQGSPPVGFILLQNYPNPFNPSTVISFQLPVNSHVTLKVFDVNGREVATLIEGEMTAGKHHVPFAPRDLAGGLYFYQLTAGNFSATKKMLLIK